jgi:AraC-like DNA-binding protein
MREADATTPQGPTAHVSVLRLLAAGLEGLAGAGPGGARPVGAGPGKPAGLARPEELNRPEELDRPGDGAAPDRPADAAGRLPADDTVRVPTASLSRLWSLGLVATDDPCLGVKAAGRWRLGRLQLMDYLVANAPTLAEALRVMERYAALLNTAPNEIRLTGGAGSPGTVTYQIRSGDPEVDAVASQYALAAALFRARYVAGREIRPLHVGLTSAAPPRHRELADRFGARRIDFGAETTTMTLASADLSLPLPDADPRLGAVLRQHAAEVIAAQASAPAGAVPSPFTDRLRRVIAAHLADGGLSLPEVAGALALSPRSLQRRLAGEGTTWSDLVDEVRRERAAALLARGLSRTAVAARLGFADARALRGALHRWRAGPGL